MATDMPVNSSMEARAVPEPSTTIEDSLLQSVSWICDHYGLGKSPQALTAGLPKGSLLAIAGLGSAGQCRFHGWSGGPAPVCPAKAVDANDPAAQGAGCLHFAGSTD